MKKFVNLMIAFLPTSSVFACTVCFGGDPDDPMAKGLNMGILTLLFFIGAMLIGFAKFFLNLRKRAIAYQSDQGVLTNE